MKAVRSTFLLLLTLLGACTMRSAIGAFTSEQDRALAQEMVAHLRSGDEAWLRQHFRPDLWEQSGKQVAQAPDLYPIEPGTTELVSVNLSSNRSNGSIQRSKEFTLVTEGSGRWAVTRFRTYSEGGPDLVVQWSVVPHETPPPELAMIQAWDAALPFVWGVLVVVVLSAGGLVFWLVRRSRRARGTPAGQDKATP